MLIYLHPFELNTAYDLACWRSSKDIAGEDMPDFCNAYDGCAFE